MSNKIVSRNSPAEEEDEDDEEIIVCSHLPNKREYIFVSPKVRREVFGNSSGFGAEAVKTAAVAGVAGVGVPTVATAGLTAVGFTGSGIAAGSMAAASQAAIGNVAAGSFFATLQSIGATGGFAILGPVGLGAALLLGGGYGIHRGVKWLKKKERQLKIKNQLRINPNNNLNTSPIKDSNVCAHCWCRMQVLTFKYRAM